MLGLLEVLPHHVQIAPKWFSYVIALVILVPMAAVTFSAGNALFWQRAERIVIILFAAGYVANTTLELADMIGIITLHPPETRAVSLLSSSLAIWVTNVLAFAMLYWQLDRGGPSARESGENSPDWLFPQAATPDVASPDWRPLFLDYLSLAYNTATAFSPTDVLPLSRRAKMLMMLESGIALLTLVIVAARAVNAIT
ncbi:hypothetical protein [Arvimicrobium flavum]|uniref:hypothetical protein n=1 Tax=Arvimicrobium flavum TaxID=3393320 RepID=UPI00237A90C0|nr:hypothetical protein [Mesorhizobium shangrilense]